ncbi:cellulosome enzyme [Seiridium cupressi]
MPSALVWGGGLKAVLEVTMCFKRYNSLYEKVEAQLKKLTFELSRLTSYEELFSQSEDLEELIISSYIHILKFWATVEEQCLTSSFLLAAKSLTSFKTKRLDNILSDIAINSTNIEKLVPIVQERLRQGERKDAVNERRMTGITLDGILNIGQKEHEARRRNEVRQWIQGGHSLNESNDRHQHKHEKVLLQGTGQWILTDERWLRWVDPDSKTNVLWLNGDPGVGKSVICAYTACSIRNDDPSCAVISQYFSFDEVQPLSTVYRNIAEQLFYLLHGSEEEVSEYVYDITQSPGSEATTSLKRLIKTLVMELKTTYIFLDGFDEDDSISTNGQEAIDFIPILYDTVQEAGVNVIIACCDALGWNTQSTYTTAFVNAGVIDGLGVITSHAYSYDAKTPLNQTDLPKWNTEAGPSSAFVTTWYSSGADNEGFTWANKIAVAMVNAQLSAYLFWEGFEIEETQSGSHLVDTIDGTTATPSGIFWAFAMWSRYIRPGAVMLGTSGSITSVITGAFQNTDESIILVFTNSGTSSQSASASFNGFTAGSASAWLTSQGSTCAATETILSGGMVTVSIPAKGVVTVKLTTGSGSGGTTTLVTRTTSTVVATTTASSCTVAVYEQCAGQSYSGCTVCCL